MKHRIVKVALDTPLDFVFDYCWVKSEGEVTEPLPGHLVVVPFGRREVVGLVIGIEEHSAVPPEKLKTILTVRDCLAPLSGQWLALCRFAADYYQRPLGEVAIPALPKNLRAIKPLPIERALKKQGQSASQHNVEPVGMPILNAQQQAAAATIASAPGFMPILLHGVTGSGKTEVYLQAAAQILARSETEQTFAQVMILVPEINLTPQLENNIRARFPAVEVATLHSGLAEGERLRQWLAVHMGRARIVLGTRLAVLASLPHLK